jgi:hypothetical protein
VDEVGGGTLPAQGRVSGFFVKSAEKKKKNSVLCSLTAAERKSTGLLSSDSAFHPHTFAFVSFSSALLSA